MYYKKFITFLKEHNLYDEEILEYWKNNKLMFDYRDDEKRELIGCFYKIENNILKEIKIIVPFFDNDKTVLINIHEYVHLLLIYPQMGKKYEPGIDKEILPIFFEKIYLKENETKELLKYYTYLTNFINTQSEEDYIIALNISDKLIKTYNNDNINKLTQKSKKLVKKYKIAHNNNK